MSMGLAALIAWLLTATIGGYMLRTWVARGGLRRQRATGVGVPPAVVFGHASAALAGLMGQGAPANLAARDGKPADRHREAWSI